MLIQAINLNFVWEFAIFADQKRKKYKTSRCIGKSYLKMATIDYLDYTLTYSDKKIVVNNSNSKWQDAIDKWNQLGDKSFDNYKKYRNTISSLKNRVFSLDEWEVVNNHWQEISNIIVIGNQDPIELYEKLTGETRKPNDCLELFKKIRRTKEKR